MSFFKAGDESNLESAKCVRSRIIKMFLIFAILENGPTEKEAPYDLFSILFYITHMQGVHNRSYAYALTLSQPTNLTLFQSDRICRQQFQI